MKIKQGFIVREVAGKTVAVAVGEASRDFHGMITLNGTALFIWQQLESDTTEAEIVKKILKTYDVGEKQAQADVRNTLEVLKNAGIIEE